MDGKYRKGRGGGTDPIRSKCPILNLIGIANQGGTACPGDSHFLRRPQCANGGPYEIATERPQGAQKSYHRRSRHSVY